MNNESPRQDLKSAETTPPAHKSGHSQWTALLGPFDYSNAGERRVMEGDPDGDNYRLVANVNPVAPRVLRGKNATPYNAPDQERDERARLIAAAPDLYEAADEALNVLIGCCIPSGGVDDRKAMLDVQRQLRLALSRARGES
jgi:hypothetical protein